jgi:hypothetical protein
MAHENESRPRLRLDQISPTIAVPLCIESGRLSHLSPSLEYSSCNNKIRGEAKRRVGPISPERSLASTINLSKRPKFVLLLSTVTRVQI